MPSITETIAALDRAQEQENARKRAQPLIIYGGTVEVVYQQKYPECPYGDEYFPAFIEKGTAYLNQFGETKGGTFNEVTQYGFKKPGFFGKKKKHKMEVFWVNSKLMTWKDLVSFNKALKRKDNTELPISVCNWYVFRFNTFDAKKFKDWCISVKTALVKDKVMLRYGDVEALVTYDVRYNLGDCYLNKFLSAGKYNIVKTPASASATTADQKISVMLSDSATKLLEKLGFVVWKGKVAYFE